jgi:hypothetical protein
MLPLTLHTLVPHIASWEWGAVVITNFKLYSLYTISMTLMLAVCAIAAGYVFQTIAVNAGRISDLQSIEASIQERVAEVAKSPPAEQLKYLKDALSDLNAQRTGKQKEIDYGNRDFWGLTFQECKLPINPMCFHRNSSAGNIQYMAVGCGLLGVCLFFFMAIRTDAFSQTPQLFGSKALISAVCLVPTGAILGLLALFIMRGARGVLLTPVSNVISVESPYGIAFACILAAFFADRIVDVLSSMVSLVTPRKQDPTAPVKQP